MPQNLLWENCAAKLLIGAIAGGLLSLCHLLPGDTKWLRLLHIFF